MTTEEKKWAAQRQDERYRAGTPLRFAARLVLPDLSSARKVSVLDISRNGAKVDTGNWPDLPRELYLMLPGPGGRDKIRLVCKKRWQVGEKIGVRFEAELSETAVAALSGSTVPVRSEGTTARNSFQSPVYSEEMMIAIGQ